MGLMIVVGWLSDANPGENFALWILLVGAMGLTWWECREREYRTIATLWWVSFVTITHVLGYIILRFLVRPPGRT